MISVGLIGCGAVAESGHLPTILRHRLFRLTAVCDIDLRRAQLLAHQAGGVPAYTDWHELLAREKLDAVVLALPPETSPNVVIECLRRNLAVLDEKPLAVTIADGRRLAGAIGETRGVYQIGFVLRYGDWVQEISRLAYSLGPPLRIRAEIFDERFDPADVAHFSRIQNFLKNSSAMTHEGSHLIDLVSCWNNFPWTSARASVEQTSPFLAGPNIWNARIEFSDRSLLELKIAWLLPELPPSSISIEGATGQLDFNCATGRGSCRTGNEQLTLTLSPLAPEWQRQYDAFAEAIQRGRADFATVVDGLRALEVTAACEASARTGREIVPADLEQETASHRFDTSHDAAAQSRQHLERAAQMPDGQPRVERQR